MKRVICAAFAILLGLLIFSSCGKNKAQPEDDPSMSQLSLEDVKLLAKLADDLKFADFPNWEAASQMGEAIKSSPSESKSAIYSVEGGYRLVVRAEDGETLSSVRLEHIWNNTGIDIRGADIDAFVRENPSSEAIMVEEAREILISLLGSKPKLEEIIPQVRINDEVCHVFIDKKAQRKYAVGNRYGNAYEITTDEAGELLTGIPLGPAPKE